MGRRFHRHGGAIALALVVGIAALFVAISALPAGDGRGFYAILSHNAMIAIFLPAFLLPLISIAVSIARYWRAVGGQPVRPADLRAAFRRAGQMTDLAAGHGEGCNFEEEDRFTHARRYAHQLVLYGFLLCFAATSVATVMHYLLNMPAPYSALSLPKLLGVSGGILLTIGCGWMMALKLRSDRAIGDAAAWGGELGFIVLLGFTGFSGLALYLLGGTGMMPALLALHLGAVLAFFLLMPFTKMAHGFYRLAALVRDAQRKRISG